MRITTVTGRVIEVQHELLEVTSFGRPDPRWCQVDRAGHEHRWFVGNAPASIAYDPTLRYHVPTAHNVTVGHEPAVLDEAGEIEQEACDVTEFQCLQCGDVIRPGTTSDDTCTYIQGMRRILVDGVPVSQEELERVLEQEGIAYEWKKK